MRPLEGYPTSWGSTRASVAPILGPTSYTQLTVDSPPNPVATGGQEIEAVSFGLKLLDFVIGGLSDSGAYFVRAVPKAASGVPGSDALATGAAQTTYRLVWYIEATGAEVAAGTNLSLEVVRCLGIGPK
jgi:hypothetical protein